MPGGTTKNVSLTNNGEIEFVPAQTCLLYTSPSPRDRTRSRMPSSAWQKKKIQQKKKKKEEKNKKKKEEKEKQQGRSSHVNEADTYINIVIISN